MILGLHNMTDAVAHYFKDHVNADGGGSILLLNSILLIPMIFAVFFYPVQVFAALAAVMVVALVFMVLARAIETHRHRIGHQ